MLNLDIISMPDKWEYPGGHLEQSDGTAWMALSPNRMDRTRCQMH